MPYRSKLILRDALVRTWSSRTSRREQVVKKVKLVLRNRGLKFTDIQDTDTETKRIAAISSFKNDESVKVIVMTTGPEVVGEADAMCSG